MKIYTEWDPVITDTTEKEIICFHCCKKVTYPMIFWSGGQDIFLHLKCAIDLGKKLIIDANEN